MRRPSPESPFVGGTKEDCGILPLPAKNSRTRRESMPGWPNRPLRFVAAGLLCTASLWAQDASTGVIRGTAEDQSGARIVGAQVVATNEANGLDRRTLSDSKGTFAAQLLSPGDYT